MVFTSFEGWRARFITSLAEMFILHLVSTKDRYGGELVILSKNYIDQSVKISTVYAILKRLSDNGFLNEKFISSEKGITRGKPRIYYSLEKSGAEYLQLMAKQIQSSHIFCDLDNIILLEDQNEG